MDIHELNNATSKLDEKNRAAIIETINIKTESDMEKMLAQMQNEFGILRAELSKIDVRFAHMEDKMDNKFAHIEDKISMMKWVIGVGGAVLTIVISILAMKIH